MVGAPLDDRVASLDQDLRVVEHQVDFALQAECEIHRFGSVHQGMRRRTASIADMPGADGVPGSLRRVRVHVVYPALFGREFYDSEHRTVGGRKQPDGACRGFLRPEDLCRAMSGARRCEWQRPGGGAGRSVLVYIPRRRNTMALPFLVVTRDNSSNKH